ncbi:Hypothetical protein Tpal_518 [Trichococcus palustris]|uniref:Uncharacterized protein n=1 Tax=Trichococcus palustris TaxID=140314 RepID=A0A143YAT1_9LACT|nr:hypothetical protein [Trichococcus palustris]CZQ84653.1 Hypothetical protein Tpal_518 [Trichococcus palustris]SFK53677.1 hypothetical protein SAMN04488076_1012 [Trichococcus palustris]
MGYSDWKELIKDAKNFATGANDLQLRSVLLDLQDAMFNLSSENFDLRNRINELENQQILESELEYKGSVYYRKKDNRYFCGMCWETDKILSSALDRSGLEHENKTFWCEVCKRPRHTEIPNMDM